MKRAFVLASAVAALIVPAIPGSVKGQALIPPLQVPDYQAICTEGVKKVDTGIEVIGASPANIQAARSANEKAKQLMSNGDYYGCSLAVQQGLSALKAG